MIKTGAKRKYVPKKSTGRVAQMKYQRKNYSDTNKIHYIKRFSGFYGPLTLSNTATTQGAFSLRLADVPGYTELTAMYDQYKICGAEFRFYPKQTQSIDSTTNGAAPVSFITAIDYTYITAGSPDDLRQYDSCKISCVFDKHVHYVRNPKCQLASGQVTDEWVATSSPTLSWFGLKYAAIKLDNVLPVFFYNVEVKFYLCFRNLK